MRPGGGSIYLQIYLKLFFNVFVLGAGPARDVHERGVVEVGLELAGVQGGGHDHQLQVLPGGGDGGGGEGWGGGGAG